MVGLRKIPSTVLLVGEVNLTPSSNKTTRILGSGPMILPLLLVVVMAVMV